MARFRYSARTSSGETVTGVLDGESREAALGRLEGRGLFPVEIAPALPQTAGESWRHRVKAEEITNVFRQLADLLGAGVPLLPALQSISAQTSNPALATILSALEADVAQGGSLASACARHPRHFSSLESNMIQAAEAGGFLADALERVAAFREKRSELLGKVRAKLAYPIVLLSVGCTVVVILMVWAVPKFQSIFAQMGGVLPLPTRILLGLSQKITTVGPLVIALILVALVGFSRFRQTTRGREFLDRLKLRLPLLGNLVRGIGLARFSRTLGLLLGGGVPVLRSLAIASGGTGNVIMQQAVDSAADSVREGESLAEPLRETGVIPATAVEMISTGEQSARLPAVLERIADSYDVRVDRQLEMMVSLMEPALIVVMAGLVGFVVFALLLPVFTISNLVQ
jgi:type II secretory pathway component PulF